MSTVAGILNQQANRQKGPDIVTDGLIMYLDASNPNSYNGSGTTWNDLSGNGNNGTLVNGPSFDGESFIFDGVNDHVNIPDNQDFQFANTQPFSFNFWYKCTATSGNFSVVLAYALTSGRGYYFTIDLGLLRTNGFFFDYWDGSAYRGIQGVTNSMILNEWVMLTATSATNSVNDMKVYQNGVLTSFTNRGTGTPNTINYDTLPMNIGVRQSGGYFTGNIAQVSIYNRALTLEEITQNYNAVKDKYSL